MARWTLDFIFNSSRESNEKTVSFLNDGVFTEGDWFSLKSEIKATESFVRHRPAGPSGWVCILAYAGILIDLTCKPHIHQCLPIAATFVSVFDYSV